MRGCALRKVVRNLAHENWNTGESNPSTSLPETLFQGNSFCRVQFKIQPSRQNHLPRLGRHHLPHLHHYHLPRLHHHHLPRLAPPRPNSLSN